MYIELSHDEVHEAFTEWLNNHRFKEPILAKGVHLACKLMLVNPTNGNPVSDIRIANIIDYTYVRDELGGKHE